MLKRILPLLYLMLTAVNIQTGANTPNFTFDQFPYLDNFPSNSVIRIYNDKDGYMWFGTKDGLCRFDGYSIKVFRSSAWTPGKLTHNEIRCIAEDNEHQLWVGTLEGVNIIDKRNFTVKPLDLKYTQKERINTILTDSRNRVWIGTSNYGVLVVNPKTGQFERLSGEKDSRLTLKGNDITNIYEDNTGKIWISLWKRGLCYIDPDLKHIFYLPTVGKNNNPFRFYQDKEGLYWICTWGDGIFTMSMDKTAELSLHPVPLKISGENIDHIIYSIIQDDKFGFIWIVTFHGLRLIEKVPDGTFKLLNANTFFDETVNKMFHEITKDRLGNLWIGSVGEGAYKLDFNKQSIQNFPLGEIKNTLNVPPFVTHISELDSDEILVVINRIGLFCYNPKTGIIRRPQNLMLKGIQSINVMTYFSDNHEIWLANEGEETIHVFVRDGEDLKQTYSFSLTDSKTSRENIISVLYEDSRKNVWIGTHTGLYLKPDHLPPVLISPHIKFVNTIEEDATGKVWIGTEKEGVFECIPPLKGDKLNFTIKTFDLKIKNYQSYSVQSICCARNGDIYIGTREGCLYFYNTKLKSAEDISGLYGITEEGILNILEDNYGVLWISTLKRIVRYNPATHTSIYYSGSDGMLIGSFFKDACLKLNSGQILFGGNKGMCVFTPSAQNILLKPKSQNVVISDILIQNKSIFDDDKNSHFDAPKNRVTLRYTESNISIEFTALDQSSTNKIQYAYKLSDADKDWTYVGNNRRFVNYTNLPSGNYNFSVKASDENGLWGNKITSLKIEILPPPYRTWWAYMLYLISITSLSVFLIKMINNRIRLKHKLKISQIENLKSEELAQTKLRYFTNISHELLTPLTIITLLIENLQKKNREDLLAFDMMKTNVLRLKRLIQQILVFRKSESGNLKLKIYRNDIIAFVKNICQSGFQPLINAKAINFSIDAERDSYMAFFDPDKLDKILYNLLSNAFKYTPKGGTITVKISFIERTDKIIMRLSVADSGEGIAEEDLPHIFKRFYTGVASDPGQSHGIGLSLTNELLLIHKGSIEVKSSLGEGSVFTIEIPVSCEAYLEAEVLEEKEIPFVSLPETDGLIPTDDIPEEIEIVDIQDYVILVVEDNYELNKLIVENFAKNYEVLSAVNGRLALDILQKQKVDLVISDVMMPEMDGLTLCKKIKNDMTTSHIHVLMLTARNSTNDRIECYNAGADAYIAKPFELRVLVARVNNLIRKRKQKMEKFQNNQEINISSMEYGSIDEEFLKQAVAKVESRLSDITFDYDKFAVDMGSSKSTLHRKLKSLTGLAPGEFIRNIRLKHAAKMIVSNAGNISEIAYAAGFNDPKYFARCFKSEFGLTPTEYQDSNK